MYFNYIVYSSTFWPLEQIIRMKKYVTCEVRNAQTQHLLNLSVTYLIVILDVILFILVTCIIFRLIYKYNKPRDT